MCLKPGGNLKQEDIRRGEGGYTGNQKSLGFSEQRECAIASLNNW